MKLSSLPFFLIFVFPFEFFFRENNKKTVGRVYKSRTSFGSSMISSQFHRNKCSKKLWKEEKGELSSVTKDKRVEFGSERVLFLFC